MIIAKIYLTRKTNRTLKLNLFKIMQEIIKINFLFLLLKLIFLILTTSH